MHNSVVHLNASENTWTQIPTYQMRSSDANLHLNTHWDIGVHIKFTTHHSIQRTSQHTYGNESVLIKCARVTHISTQLKKPRHIYVPRISYRRSCSSRALRHIEIHMNQYEYLQSIYVNTQKYLKMYHLGKVVWFRRARLVAVPLQPFK